MATRKPTAGRGPGRPRKEPEPAPPRYPALPFQLTRDRLAAQLRKVRDGQNVPAAAVPLQSLVAVSDEGVVALQHAVVGPLGHPFRFDLTATQVAMAADVLRQRQAHHIRGHAPNSRRTKAGDWLTWLAFCAHFDRVVLPASFDDVAEFVGQLIAAGRKKATIEHILWAMADIHRRHGCADPMDSVTARDWWRDRLREDLDGSQKQADPLRLELLEQLVDALETQRSPLRRARPELVPAMQRAQARRRLRDVAMLNVAYDLMMRASELVSVEWGRIHEGPRGQGGTYRFGKTKTDQVGEGAVRYLRPETMVALAAWRAESPIGGYVFHAVADDLYIPVESAQNERLRESWEARRLDAEKREHAAMKPGEVNNVFRRASDLAGVRLDQTWLSGHSARVGAAQDMVLAGATTAEVQIAGRWKNERMPVRYAEQVLAADAGEKRFAQLAKLPRKTR